MPLAWHHPQFPDLRGLGRPWEIADLFMQFLGLRSKSAKNREFVCEFPEVKFTKFSPEVNRPGTKPSITFARSSFFQIGRKCLENVREGWIYGFGKLSASLNVAKLNCLSGGQSPQFLHERKKNYSFRNANISERIKMVNSSLGPENSSLSGRQSLRHQRGSFGYRQKCASFDSGRTFTMIDPFRILLPRVEGQNLGPSTSPNLLFIFAHAA